MLHLSKGNGKLSGDTLIFSLPAGKTCPGADQCKSMALIDDNGKRYIQDGPNTLFRCFAASGEVQYDAPFNNRADNYYQIQTALMQGLHNCVELINSSIQKKCTKKTTKVRIHESGDFFSGAYLDAWIQVAKLNPDLKFYCYSKSLQLFYYLPLPSNFYMTASYGGKWDKMIDDRIYPRYSKVVMFEEDADALGLEVDHDDSHCFGDKPFALLVHGTQAKGSPLGVAIRQRRAQGLHAGYSKKNKVAA
jgi:hypothetical protein